ncbi:MAG: hydrogenobyrinic acid a,c-diamide synthase (glutamine-hydrolyzing) [Planctomycetes bacterium]|nr:hydrogenobyrinic acid a,c-diamide synthase (glutamine-hydrolyzing) [Planctomycetota bacterium]
MPIECPRLLIAGTSGDSGKTVVTLGLARAFARQGLEVTAFKKGPDFIDAAWLSAASGRTARNLDTFLARPQTVKRSFIDHAVQNGVNLIEGNRGLHDGMDVRGSHSSAALSKLIQSPIILVQDVRKTTRSAVAFVLGSRLMDEDLEIAGVILNRLGTARQEDLIRRVFKAHCDVPVLGALPRFSPRHGIPMRHLGLITPQEKRSWESQIDHLADVMEARVDLKRLLKIARKAPALEGTRKVVSWHSDGCENKVRICYFSDSAFTFYYPENLEALKSAGADLIPVSALHARELPACDGLYIGGGFPETHAAALSKNSAFRRSLFKAAERGLPVYAECGGLVYLSDSLAWEGKVYPMAGVFPIPFVMEKKPQGHGYARALVDGNNPFFEKGTVLKGHEFHYSRPEKWAMKSIFEIKRGTGCGKQRDGLLRWNVLGTYVHIHATGCPAWAQGMVQAAKRHRKE